jgi:hypothetical protein
MRWMLVAAVSTGCAGSKDGDPADSGAEVAFTAVRDDILLPSCGFSTCHGSGTGDLTLDEAGAHAALVDAPSAAAAGEILVVPGDPDGSYLVKKLEGAAGIVGDPMPPPSGGMAPADLAAIRSWIAQGASP